MSTVLDRIVASKRQEIDRSKAAVSEGELRRRLADCPPPRSLATALADPAAMHLIAEVKRASPSAGLLKANFDPAAIGTVYATHGASAISVLTDQPFFQGTLDDLSQVRQRVAVPVLRKDFLLDPYQIAEARVAGADSVLLIAEILPNGQLRNMLEQCRELGIEPLVELHDPDNLDRVVESGARIIGINNRNLRTFVTDLAQTIDLAGRIHGDRILVSESGISCRADVQRLKAAGVRAILVGETLMRAENVPATINELIGF